METRPKYKYRLADVGLFYAAAIWGSTFFLVKDALGAIDPIVLVAYRFLLAGVVMAVACLILRRNLLEGWKEGLLLGLLIWALYVPQTIGLKYTSASNSGFITGLFVIFVPIFLRFGFRKRPGILEWVASAVALVGLWILTGGMSDMNLGDTLTLLAAVTYALHVLFADRYIKAGRDPIVLATQQFLLVGVLSLITALLFDLDLAIHSGSALKIMLFLAIFPTLSAFLIQMWAQTITTPVRVSLIFAFEPVFAALFAWTLGGEVVVFHRALGGLFIFTALVISGLPSPGKKETAI